MRDRIRLAKAWLQSKLPTHLSEQQMEIILNDLEKQADNDFYGRDEQDIEWLFQTFLEYRVGKLKIMPLAAFNIMSPVLPKEQDYTVYDDIIRRRISRLEDSVLREVTAGMLLPLDREPRPLDPKIQTGLRATRNLHNFQLLERLATISEDEFVDFVKEYAGKGNINLIYDRFKIPRPFLFVPREDDNYQYFE